MRLFSSLGVDDEAVVNFHTVPLMGPVQDVHYVLLELLVLVDSTEVRGGKVLLRRLVSNFLICIRIFGVVFKVKELISSDKGIRGGQACVDGLGFLLGRGFCWLYHWLKQGRLRLDLPEQSLEVTRGVPGGVKVGFHLCPHQR